MVQNIRKSKTKTKNPKLRIYGENWCGYCKESKRVANQLIPGFDIKKHYITGKTTDYLKKKYKIKKLPNTIPLIFLNDKFIGGYTNFMKIL